LIPDVLRKFVRLPAHDRTLLVRTVFTLAAARLATWFLPFALSRRLLARAQGAPANITGDRIRWAMTHAQRVVPRATCLPQALAAEALLTSSGLPAQLQIGVAKTASGGLYAHAWVESDGRIVVGDLPGGLDVYTRLPTIPREWPGSRAAR
jgi:hypothetical protein